MTFIDEGLLQSIPCGAQMQHSNSHSRNQPLGGKKHEGGRKNVCVCLCGKERRREEGREGGGGQGRGGEERGGEENIQIFKILTLG